MYEGEAHHPVFVALRGTAKKYGIPRQPFADLIRAFIQDQTVTRYPDLGRRSRLLRLLGQPRGTPRALSLRLFRPERQRLSDATCTALQLANFWQDVTVDH
jgi:phytoene/squalene synthetase